jgi:predicted metalloendopeptidase
MIYPEQRFFHFLDNRLENKIVMKQSKSSKTDPHSPGMYRAYVPIQNVDAFL